jgi:hypothetical protein
MALGLPCQALVGAMSLGGLQCRTAAYAGADHSNWCPRCCGLMSGLFLLQRGTLMQVLKRPSLYCKAITTHLD